MNECDNLKRRHLDAILLPFEEILYVGVLFFYGFIYCLIALSSSFDEK